MMHYRIEGRPLAECGSSGISTGREYLVTCPICERIARHERIIERCMPLLVDGIAWTAGELAHRTGESPHQIAAALTGERGQRAGVCRTRCGLGEGHRGAKWVYWWQGPAADRSCDTGKSKPM
jgi:hypothetical protein